MTYRLFPCSNTLNPLTKKNSQKILSRVKYWFTGKYVVKVLRRIIGKTVSWTLKDEIKEAAGLLQTCSGHNAGAEAAIHGMNHVFAEEGTSAILLIDASNAFATFFSVHRGQYH